MPLKLPLYPIFNLLTYLLLCIIYVMPLYRRSGLLYKQRISNGLNFTFYFIVAALFCIFSFTSGDFVNYYYPFRNTVVLHTSAHFEPPYVWIINHITHNYLIWRAVVWGSATLITLLALRRMRLRAIPTYAAFTIFYLTTLYVMRGNLGTALMLYGLAIIFYPRKHIKYIDWVLGVGIIWSSYYFHKSMLLSLALLIPSVYNWSKKSLTISFCCFPLAVGLMRGILAYLGENGLEGTDETISNSSMRYSNVEAFQFNAFGILRNIVVYFPTYLILIYAYTTDILKKIPKKIQFFFNYWYLWVYIASVCAFQEVGGWYYSRFMFMSNLPLVVFMAYVFQNEHNSKLIKAIIFTGFLSSLYILAYAYYQIEFK